MEVFDVVLNILTVYFLIIFLIVSTLFYVIIIKDMIKSILKK